MYGHGFLLSRGEKMSKSVGNVVDPMVLAERFGVDALRYFLLREVTFGQDGSYSAEAIVNRANAELANSFGNLAQRTLSMISKNCDGVLARDPMGTMTPTTRCSMLVCGAAQRLECPQHFGDLALTKAIEAWMQAVFACNPYIDAQAPWALRKTDPRADGGGARDALRLHRDLAVAIRPVIPASADRLLDQMGVRRPSCDFDGILSRLVSPLARKRLPPRAADAALPAARACRRTRRRRREADR